MAPNEAAASPAAGQPSTAVSTDRSTALARWKLAKTTTHLHTASLSEGFIERRAPGCRSVRFSKTIDDLLARERCWPYKSPPRDQGLRLRLLSAPGAAPDCHEDDEEGERKPHTMAGGVLWASDDETDKREDRYKRDGSESKATTTAGTSRIGQQDDVWPHISVSTFKKATANATHALRKLADVEISKPMLRSSSSASSNLSSLADTSCTSDAIPLQGPPNMTLQQPPKSLISPASMIRRAIAASRPICMDVRNPNCLLVTAPDSPPRRTLLPQPFMHA